MKQFRHGTYVLIPDGRRNVLTGSEADKVSNVQKTKAKSNSETRKKKLTSNTDMTMCGRPGKTGANNLPPQVSYNSCNLAITQQPLIPRSVLGG